MDIEEIVRSLCTRTPVTPEDDFEYEWSWPNVEVKVEMGRVIINEEYYEDYESKLAELVQPENGSFQSTIHWSSCFCNNT